MNAEAKYLVKELNLSPQDFKPKIKLYSGNLNNISLSLIVPEKNNGVEQIGYIPSSITTLEIIQHINPDLILSVGTAGGVGKKGCKIGDIFLSTGKIFYHDRFLPDIYKNYSYGGFLCHEITNYNLHKKGIVSSSASTIITKESWEVLKLNQVDLVDMEAAAIAEICSFYGKKMSAIKVITDLVDIQGAVESQFINNFKPCMEKLSSSLPEILNHIVL